MGTFQVTYDDFTGGHYVGDRSAELPKNTWRGTNATVGPRGDLIPNGAKEIATVTAPAITPGHPWENCQIWDSYLLDVTDAVYFVTWRDMTGPTFYWNSKVLVCDYSKPTYPVTQYALTGRCTGRVTYDNFRTGPSVDNRFTYIDNNPAQYALRQWDFNTGTDSLVLAAFLGNEEVYDLYKVGSRLVTHQWRGRKLFYSGALDAATWSATTQYIEFPDVIQRIYPRTNDFLVFTNGGVFSVTGVLGETTNIQTIVPNTNIYTGLADGAIDSRTIYAMDEAVSAPGYMDGTIYALVGSSMEAVATLDQSDLNPVQQTYRNSANLIALGIGQGNALVAYSRSGATWIRNQNGTWARFKPNSAIAAMAPNGVDRIGIAKPLANGGTFPANEFVSVAYTDTDFTVHCLRMIANMPLPNSDDYSFDYNTNTASAPASASVDLAEYWHSKPMVVKEVIVEAVFDTAATLNLTGNATIQPFVMPTGIIDKGPNDTGSYISSTQTVTQAISGITSDNSRAIYRFRINDAGRSYGFYPRITWQGCRIRRVICVCED